eukprot:gene7538-10272_t
MHFYKISIVALSVIATSFAFVPNSIYFSSSSRSSLKMNVWGVQKLGQSVIDIAVTPVQGTETSSIFKRVTIGSGSDERKIPTEEEEEENNASLSRMYKSFKQKSLLMGLEGNSWGFVEKQERIRLAASVENLLPSSFASEVVTSANMYSGGLMKDWEF